MVMKQDTNLTELCSCNITTKIFKKGTFWALKGRRIFKLKFYELTRINFYQYKTMRHVLPRIAPHLSSKNDDYSAMDSKCAWHSSMDD